MNGKIKVIPDFSLKPNELALKKASLKVRKNSLLVNDEFSGLKIVYASKKEIEEANKKCLKKYHDVFKELAQR